MRELETEVLVVGAGAAGMQAALAAARSGAKVVLADRSLIGRGGATVMAQMTVAVALGAQEPDHWRHHLKDTLAAGRGLCDPALARLLCEEGVECILELDRWGVGWARENGRIKQVHAPGHDRPRCVYVDYLNTGPAVSRTLRARVIRTPEIRRVGDLRICELLVRDGECLGALALHMPSGDFVAIPAKATVIATGGLTRLYRRNSASLNMGGDGYALALRAGAELTDMEFVQFFPIGHLAPRLVGMDPIMWDPFRYKLGGKLLNAAMEEFTERYGTREDGRYVITRDVATYAIAKEVEAGRGSPHGGVYLSFQHCSEDELRAAFGPVIDRLAKNGIDLRQTPVEVAPIAHYHMGGIRVTDRMETGIAGLYAAGEAVGGANGANRLSGNAITEALVFGRRAGEQAARHASKRATAGGLRAEARAFEERLSDVDPGADFNATTEIAELQTVMGRDVGPFRQAASLNRAIAHLERLRALCRRPPRRSAGLDPVFADWLDLRDMRLVAEAVARAAHRRTESRGAHQREDHPGLEPDWEKHQVIRAAGEQLRFADAPAANSRMAAA